MYEDTKNFIRRSPNCHRHGGITAHDSMPLNYNLQVELFDVWGIDYMGPFVRSQGCEYILVTVDYVSKWVEACHAEPLMQSITVRCSMRLSFQGLAQHGW